MDLALLSITAFMHFLTKTYNDKDYFKNFYIDVIVQILHIFTLVFIIIATFKAQNILVLIYGISLLFKNLKACILNILYYNKSDEDEEEENDDNENLNENEEE